MVGASPRAALHVLRAARAHAALEARDHVLPDDVQRVAPFQETTLPIARAIVQAYVLDPDKLPWYIDLLNINLNNNDLALARERIARYKAAFKSEGSRITENLDTLPSAGKKEV